MPPRTPIKPVKNSALNSSPKRPRTSHASKRFGSPKVGAGKRRAFAGPMTCSPEERPPSPARGLTYELTKKFGHASDSGYKTGDLIRRILQIERGREIHNEELYEIVEFLLSGVISLHPFDR